jgi:Sec-independent protein translocase protein TatA
MKFFNLGLGEIILIVVLALIIFGPGNMVKTAREAGTFIRKVTKSPYWREIWATKRELNEIPKMLAKEAELDETLRDLDKETKTISSTVAASVSELIKEVNQPLENRAVTAPVKPAEEPGSENTSKPETQASETIMEPEPQDTKTNPGK